MNAIASSTRGSTALDGSDRLLRLAVRLDALVSGVFGLALLGSEGFVGDLLGMPAAFLGSIGGVCLVYAGLLWLLQMRSVITAPTGWAVVLGNTLWVAASILLVASGLFRLTPIGIGFVLLQAALVAGFAYLQWVGLRRAGA